MQQYQAPFLKCSKVSHDGQQVNGLCLRPECDQVPAQCQTCTLESHKNCIDSIKMLKDIPKLTQPFQEIKNGLLEIQKQINKLIKELIALIEQESLPISKYFETPNLSCLNELAVYLKKDPLIMLQNQVIKTQKEINSLFPKYTDKTISGPQEIKVKLVKQHPVNQNSIQTDQNFEATKNYYLRKGNQLFQLKVYMQAMHYYSKAIKMDPNNKNIILSKGNELFQLKEYIKAMHYYSKAIELDPNNKNIILRKGNELFQLKEYDFASIYYETAIEMDPNNQEAKQNLQKVNQLC